jgi:hypothetical protein
MKVSPGTKKYVEEAPRRRGEIRHLNAEGVEVDENSEVTAGLPKDIVTQMRKAEKKAQLPAIPGGPAAFLGMPNPAQSTPLAMMTAASILRDSLLKAQGSAALQAKAAVPMAPKTRVPAKPQPAQSGILTDAAANAMEKNAIGIGLQYAMKMKQQQNKLNARAKLPAVNKFVLAQRGALARAQAVQRNRIAPPINFRPQNNLVKPGTGIAAATSPLLNPALALEPQVPASYLSDSG